MADLGKRYATALFELSAEQGMPAVFLEQAVFVRDTLQEEECAAFLVHPRITGAEKRTFFDTVFGGHIHTDLMGFLHLTVNKNREAFLLDALNKLVEMIRAHRNETTARIVSAVPLTEAQLARMAALLTRKLNKKVDVHLIIDPAVIGGLSIQADGYFIDQTMRYRLRNIKEELNSLVKRRAAHDTQA